VGFNPVVVETDKDVYFLLEDVTIYVASRVAPLCPAKWVVSVYGGDGLLVWSTEWYDMGEGRKLHWVATAPGDYTIVAEFAGAKASKAITVIKKTEPQPPPQPENPPSYQLLYATALAALALSAAALALAAYLAASRKAP